jgi:hypothetical protein
MSVKIWLLAVLLLAGCSSKKKEKDFQAALDKSPDSAPQVQVEAPKPLLDKFEVEETVQSPKKETPAAVKKAPSPKKPTSAPVVKAPEKAAEKPAPALIEAPSINKLPADYPVGLVNLNTKAEKTWKSYKSNHVIGEKIFLDIHYLGMTVGKIMVTNNGKKMINGKEVWHFHSRFKSAPFYSNIYELDDTVDTYVTTDQFLSIRYSLIQRESKQDVDDLQLHDRDQMKTFWFYKQKKSDGSIKNKQKNAFIPFYSIDPFSILFFYQGLPLKNGDAFEIPVINKGKVLVLKSEVEGREVIETEKGKQRAIRVHATTQYTGETLKSGDLYFWFSDDSRRLLLKAQAKIKIGSVTADIVKN